MSPIESSGLYPARGVAAVAAGMRANRAASVLAEVGPAMVQFGSQKNLRWWAGVCVGHKRSAGKNQGSKTARGNCWFPECAWGNKDCFLNEPFWRLASKKPRQPPATWPWPTPCCCSLSGAENRPFIS